ncbi:MAG TPA: hypothetical protein VGK73_13290, partial [Polyangiaceae bacterium]
RNEPERSQGEKPSAGEAPRASSEAAPTDGAVSNARAASEGEGSSDAEGAPPAAKNESTESSREGLAEVADETSQPETFAEAGSDARARFFLYGPIVAVEAVRVPGPSFGIGAGAGIRYGGWRVAAAGRIFLDDTLWSAELPDVGAKVRRTTVSLWTCHGWRTRRLEFSPCFAMAFEHVKASGTGPGVSPSSARSSSLLLGGGATVHFHPADWVAIAVLLEAGVATSRPRVTVDGLGEVGQLGPAYFGFGLGPEWIF